MKMAGNYFRGFPALWNVAAFYLFIVKLPVWGAAVIVVVLVALTFAPIRFVHPIRVTRFRVINLCLLALWCVLGLLALLSNLDPAFWVTGLLVVLAVYFLAIGSFAHVHEPA
jgi:phosphatidylcholine synthase